MKTLKKTFLAGLGIFAVNLLHAQEATHVDWSSASASDLDVMLQAVESVPTIPADEATNGFTLFSAQHAPGTVEAWPPLPGNIWNFPVWSLGDDNGGGSQYILKHSRNIMKI